MIYHCDSCRFTFERYSRVEACPDCGKQNIRPATAAEQKEFLRYQQEFYPGNQLMTARV